MQSHSVLVTLIFFAITSIHVHATPRNTDSLGQLKNYLQTETQRATQELRNEAEQWAVALASATRDFSNLVEHCRQLESHCRGIYVSKKLRQLRLTHTRLRMRIETLQSTFEGKADAMVLEKVLSALQASLLDFAETLKLAQTKSYKLIEQ